MIQCCIENIEDFLLIKPRDVFSSFFKGNLSSFEAWIEELIKLKQLRKEGYIFILRELTQFCSFILEVIVSSQHALHVAGYGEYILKLNAILCVFEWRETSINV